MKNTIIKALSGLFFAVSFTASAITYVPISVGDITVIIPIDDPPVALDDTGVVNEDSQLLIDVLANDSDEAGIASVNISFAGQLNKGGQQSSLAVVDNQVVYQAPANWNGTDWFEYQITDVNGNVSDIARVTVTVQPINDVPSFTSFNTSTTEDASSISIDVATYLADVDGDSLTITNASSPSGVLAINGTVISYQPNTDFYGVDTVNYYVSDGTVGIDANFTVTVSATPDAPIARVDNFEVEEDKISFLSVLSNDHDADSDVLTITSATASLGTAVIVDDQIKFTPPSNFNGQITIAYTISDGTYTANATSNINVVNVNDVPVAVDDNFSTNEDVQKNFNVRANDIDADGDVLTISEVNAIYGTVSITAQQNVKYTPPPEFNGDDIISYTIVDAAGIPASASAYITVNSVNDAPVAGDDIASVNEDSEVLINALINDTDVDEGETATLSIVANTLSASNGTVSLDTSSSKPRIKYVPNTDFFGTDTISYQVQDVNGSTDTGVVTVTIKSVNDKPGLSASITDSSFRGITVEANVDDIEAKVASVEFSLGGTDWIAGQLTSSSTDNNAETHTHTFSDVGGGDFLIKVRVTDAAGEQSFFEQLVQVATSYAVDDLKFEYDHAAFKYNSRLSWTFDDSQLPEGSGYQVYVIRPGTSHLSTIPDSSNGFVPKGTKYREARAGIYGTYKYFLSVCVGGKTDCHPMVGPVELTVVKPHNYVVETMSASPTVVAQKLGASSTVKGPLISWSKASNNPPPGFSYVIEKAIPNSDGSVSNSFVEMNTVDFNTLSDQRGGFTHRGTYQFRVKVCSTDIDNPVDRCSAPSPAVQITSIHPDDYQVRYLEASSELVLVNNSVSLTWEAPANTSGLNYVVEWQKPTDTGFNQLLTTTNTTASATLSQEGDYQFRVCIDSCATGSATDIAITAINASEIVATNFKAAKSNLVKGSDNVLTWANGNNLPAPTYNLKIKRPGYSSFVSLETGYTTTSRTKAVGFVGEYQFIIQACIQNGAQCGAYSSPVSVQVADYGLPTVSVTSPVNYAQFYTDSSVRIAASASSPELSIKKVSFSLNGTEWYDDFNAPYEHHFDTLTTPGVMNVQVKAIDSLDRTSDITTVAVNIAEALPEFDDPSTAQALANSTLPNFLTQATYKSAEDNSKIVGTIPATENVSPDGSFNYQIPIVTTGKVNGLAPELSLSYNSNAGNGVMGRGWSIGGTSSIHRCNANQEQDGYTKGLRFNAEDMLCMDGQRLVHTNPDNYDHFAPSSVYRSELHNFVRVKALGGTVGNPSKFEVKFPDGRIAYFGGDNYDGKSTNLIAHNAGVTFAWSLNRVEDASGNYIEYQYEQNTNSLEHHVTKVNYTANTAAPGSASSYIQFNYQDGALIPNKGYMVGELQTSTKKLTSVSSYSDNTLLRTYTPTYDVDVGIMTSIKVCNGSTCLPETQFEWAKGGELYDANGNFNPFYETGSSFNNIVPSNRFKGIRFADINGDGRTDILAVRNHRNDPQDHLVAVYGGEDIGESASPPRLSQFADLDFRNSWQIADLDGDSRHDILFADGGYWHYVLSDGIFYNPADKVNTWIPVYEREKARLADFNGDGYADLLAAVNDSANGIYKIFYFDGPQKRFSQTGVTVDWGTLTQQLTFNGVPGDAGEGHFFNIYTKDMNDNVVVSDFNGDGRADLMMYVQEKTRKRNNNCYIENSNPGGMNQLSGNNSDSSVISLPPRDSQYIDEDYLMPEESKDQQNGRLVGNDFNCSAYTETVRETRRVFLATATSGEFVERQIIGTSSGTEKLRPVDLNNDGLNDLVYRAGSDDATASWAFRINTGKLQSTGEDLFGQTQHIGVLGEKADVVHFSDYDLDGYVDLLYVSEDPYIINRDPYSGFTPPGYDVRVQAWRVKRFVETPTGFDFEADNVTNIHTYDYEASLFADFNGDGFADYMTHDGGDLRLYKRKHRPLRKIQKVTDGYGLNTYIGYRPLTDTAVYTRGDVSSLDYSNWGNGSRVLDIVYPMQVVHLYEKGEMVNKYHYVNGRSQVGRGTLGFSELRIHNLTTGRKEVAKYRQDFPYIGAMVSKTSSLQRVEYETVFSCTDTDWEPTCHSYEETLISYDKLSESTVSYQEKSVYPGTVFIFSERSEEKYFDVNSGQQTHQKVVSLKNVSGYTDLVDNYGHPYKTEELITECNAGDCASNPRLTVTKTTADTWSTNHYGLRLTARKVTHNRSDAANTTVRETSYQYDSATGLLEKETLEPNTVKYKVITEYKQRDTFGNPQRIEVSGENFDTRVSTYTYDSTGRFVETETKVLDDSVSLTTTYSRSNKAKAFGYVDSQTDANGFTTTNYYSNLGRLYRTLAEDGSGSQTVQLWCSDLASVAGEEACTDGAVYAKVTESKGAPTVVEHFDAQARNLRTATLNFAGEWTFTDTLYDDIGRTWRKYQPAIGATSLYYTEFKYDKLDRVIETKRPNGSIWHMAYDGLTVTQYSPSEANPQPTKAEFDTLRAHAETKDAVGLLRSVVETLPDASSDTSETITTLYGYDNVGNLILLDGPGDGAPITLSYDTAGVTTGKGYFKRAMNDPDKGNWTYTYDALGNLLTQTDGNGNQSQMIYDTLGRVTDHKRYLGTIASGSLTSHIRHTYDTASLGNTSTKALGLLHSTEDLAKRVTDAENNVTRMVKKTYSYDALGRSTGVVHALEDAVYMESKQYDAVGRVSVTTDATGGSVEYHYNQYGYQAGVVDQQTGVVYYEAKSQDEYGTVTSFSMHNDVNEGWATTHDDTGLAEFRIGGENGSVQLEEYRWDVLGNVSWRKDVNQNLEETFQYDMMNRLTHSEVHGYTTQRVRYYDNGNIRFKTGLGFYCYDSTNKPHAVRGIAGSYAGCSNNSNYSYDGNGNMTSGRGRNIDYTTFDKPSRIVKDDYVAEFSYGTDLSRYKRVDDENGEVTTTWYVGNVEYVIKDGVTTTKRHIGGFAQVIQQGNDPNSLEYRYFYKDHLGSIVASVNHKGEDLQRFSFDAWGARRGTNWAVAGLTAESIDVHAKYTVNLPVPIKLNRGFTGHEHVDGAGLIHMNGRIYDPVLARFLSADPFIQAATNTQNLNRYSYVLNNPLNATDPSGYLFQFVLMFAMNYAQGLAMGAIFSALGSFGAFLQTAYSIYNTVKMVSTIAKTYKAWSNGAGGAVWGNLIKSMAKSYAMGVGQSCTTGKCNFKFDPLGISNLKEAFTSGGDSTDAKESKGSQQSSKDKRIQKQQAERDRVVAELPETEFDLFLNKQGSSKDLMASNWEKILEWKRSKSSKFGDLLDILLEGDNYSNANPWDNKVFNGCTNNAVYDDCTGRLSEWQEVLQVESVAKQPLGQVMERALGGVARGAICIEYCNAPTNGYSHPNLDSIVPPVPNELKLLADPGGTMIENVLDKQN
ncbi:MAG: tandem-95 repeat protein [Aestuariibacter sp.]